MSIDRYSYPILNLNEVEFRSICVNSIITLDHKELNTFPQHKHAPGLWDSYSVNLEDVLNEITMELGESDL